MTLEEKQDLLADIFDCEPAALVAEATLDSFGWDSMMRVSLIGRLRVACGRRVTGAEMKSFRTVGDIFGVMD